MNVRVLKEPMKIIIDTTNADLKEKILFQASRHYLRIVHNIMLTISAILAESAETPTPVGL